MKDSSWGDRFDGPVHFMGIAGAGMSALAEAMIHSGVPVSGCDAAGITPPALERLGVTVEQGHSLDHVTGIAALIVTSAVPMDHPEVEAARAAGVPVIKRAKALASWVEGGRVVAIAGTHGKTSTTAMTTHVLEAAGLEPTGFVGGTVRAWGSNLRVGKGDLFAVEADEYDRSFLELHPDIAVVTNVEADHLDIYGDLAGVMDAYQTFLGQVRDGGKVIGCADDSGVGRLLAGLAGDVTTYGTSPGSMVRAVDVRSEGGRTLFNIVERGTRHQNFVLEMPGLHNVRNGLAAAAAARSLGVGWDPIRKGLHAFAGVGRRFERIGEVGGVLVVDDYAHHPTEVTATLEAARHAYPEARVVVVFQPHLYTRTRDFHEEFGKALAAADAVWVTDVYPAREEPIPGIDGALVAADVASAGGEATYHASLDGLATRVARALMPGDVCFTLGAGSIERVGPEIFDVLTRLNLANRFGPTELAQ